MSRSSEADLDMVVERSSRVYVRAVGSCGGNEPLLALPIGLARFPRSQLPLGTSCPASMQGAIAHAGPGGPGLTACRLCNPTG